MDLALISLVLLRSVLASPGPASPGPASQETPFAPAQSAPPDLAWSFSLEPNVWIPALEGSGSADGSPSTDIEADLFGDLAWGALLALQARAPDGRTAILADGLYVQYAKSEGALRTETEVGLAEVAVARAIGEDSGWEALVGARYVEVELDVELAGAIGDDVRKNWLDPVLGARWQVDVGRRCSLLLHGDVGGFGVGSELTWQAAGLLRAPLTRYLWLDVGYRAISVDFDDEDLEYDVLVHGPMIGLGFRFQ